MTISPADLAAQAKACVDAQSVRDFYRDTIYPAELERLRAAAPSEQVDLLFVTCGTQPESVTLSLVASPARYVVVLHTPDSEIHAIEAIRRQALAPGSYSLQSIGDGKNPIALYTVVLRIWDEKGRPQRVGMDMTGGLKVMSAAATVVASVIAGCEIYYVDSDQDRVHETLFWTNQRRLRLPNPFDELPALKRDAARRLLTDTKWNAASAAYKELAKFGEPADQWRAQLAEGYACLDQLRFADGATLLQDLSDRLRAYGLKYPNASDPMLQLTQTLTNLATGASRVDLVIKSIPTDTTAEKDPLENTLALGLPESQDMLACVLLMAKRRLNAGELDIASLLAYRVLEAVVQRHLIIRGAIDPAQVTVEQWQQILLKGNLDEGALRSKYKEVSGYDLPTPLPTQINRAQVYTLLYILFRDAVTSMPPKGFQGIGNTRNRSVLAHGLNLIEKSTADKFVQNAEKFLTNLLTLEGVSPADQAALFARHTFVTPAEA